LFISEQGVEFMKSICILATAALLLAIPILSWSEEDGAALYESNCAMCHGAEGEGMPDMEMPAVKGTSMTIDQLATYLTKGDPEKTIHADPIQGINEDQAKAIAAHVKSFKK
jgi:cytochrome c553